MFAVAKYGRKNSNWQSLIKVRSLAQRSSCVAMRSLDSVRKLQIHNESLHSHDNFFHTLFGFITKFSQQIC